MSAVIEYLRGRGAPFTVLPYAGATSPEETAHHHGIELDRLVSTVVVETSEGRVLMALPASRTLDLSAARRALGDPEARAASSQDLLLRPIGYDGGALPPLGFHLGLPLYVDPAVADLHEVVFPVGEPTALVRMSTRELFRSDPVVVTPLTHGSEREPVKVPDLGYPTIDLTGEEPSRYA